MQFKKKSKPHVLLTARMAWEQKTVENPAMLLYRGHRYLFYSGNGWARPGYAIGYALCPAITDPCKRVIPPNAAKVGGVAQSVPLLATGNVSSQRGEMLRVQGAQRSHQLSDLAVPDRYNWMPADFPRGDPFNVGQMYSLFAEAIRTGRPPERLPTFDTAVDLHRFLDTIRQSSETGRELPVG